MPDRSERGRPKDYTVHMIGNAHIDPVWLWRWQEGKAEVVATCRSALDRMKETPAFIFSRSSAVTYRWLEEDEPEMFEEIRGRVREGRWNIVNGWWVQPDCNLPCGESFVRQGLYGQRYFMDRFGVQAKVGYDVDSFGHCATLPQILKQCGLDYYIFFRPGPHEKDLPSPLFWWEAPDGSRVLTCRPPHHYNSTPDEIAERILRAYEQTLPGLRDVMCFYGVGNRGGGPTQRNIQSILTLDADPDMPSVRFSTPDAFFEKVLPQCADAPVVREDLQHHARGCYTSVSALKRYLRRCESLLMTAEKFASVVHSWLDHPYPQRALTRGWKHLLFNQFHDTLGGTCIRPACKDAEALYEETHRLAGDALDEALNRIAARVDTQGEGVPLLVFNPSPWERTDAAEARVAFPGIPDVVRLEDAEGHPVPVQVLGIEHEGRFYLLHLLFVARVPALGYRLYRLMAEDPVPADTDLNVSSHTLENTFYRIAFDPDIGCISSLWDREHDVEVCAGKGNLPLVIRDPSDTWSHGVDAFRDEIGFFHANAHVVVLEQGPVRGAIRVRSRFGNSTIVQDVRLYTGLRRVEVEMAVDWHEQHRMLKLSFPTPVEDPTATYEIPYGTLVRPTNGEEEPGQRWIDVTGMIRNSQGTEMPYGVSLFNDSKYGFDIKDSELRMTVLRSPIYAFHDPRKVEPGVTYLYTDQGEQTVRYAVIPHRGDWRDGDAVREGDALNHPFIVVRTGPHPGDWSSEGSFLRIEPEHVVGTVLKKAEDSDDLILRFYETAGRDTTARVMLPSHGVSLETPLGHHEIKTLKLIMGPEGPSWREVNMLERDEHE